MEQQEITRQLTLGGLATGRCRYVLFNHSTCRLSVGTSSPPIPLLPLVLLPLFFCFGQEPMHQRSSTQISAAARRETPSRMEVDERACKSAKVEVAPVETESVAEAVLVVTDYDAITGKD